MGVKGPRPTAESFWAKVNKQGPNGCWVWTAATQLWGYGVLGTNRGGTWRAHRFSWELHYGPVPTGKIICHRCDNPPCVNPKHLFVGTHVDNGVDMGSKRRQWNQKPGAVTQRGERNGHSKLTEKDVRAIRAWVPGSELTRKELALRYGVSESNIKFIRSRRNWRHVK